MEVLPGGDRGSAAAWARVGEIVDRAGHLAGAERVAYLDEACAADPKLREHVGTLVAAAQRSASPRRQDTSGVVTQTLTSASAIAPGRRIGHYEIVSKLGEGGMGAVYRAVDTNLGRQVALKVISRASISDEDKRRFAREAKSASALNHPNVVTVYEYSAEAGLDFIVMELVEGAPLNEILKRGETPLSTLLDYARQVAAALTKAHGAGIVHRDLKPGNIMITPDGVAKVLDFGLAKRSQGPEGPDGETMTAVTQAGIVMGTPAYMSPEQVLGEAADHSTDIFAFGVILYEMVCGQRPFKGEDTAATLRQILHKEPPPPPDTAPEAVKALIGKCLQKSRQHRLRSMAEAVALLSSSGPLRLPVSRSRGRVAALAGGLVVLGIAGSLLWCAAGRRAPAAHSVATTYPTASTHPTATASVGLDSVDGTSSELTIRARGLLRRYDKTGYLDRAIRLLESALEKDAKFAAAYATISEAYLRKGHSVTSADNHWLKLARDSAAQAVSLNPDLAEAHTSLGEVLLEGGETDRAKGEIDRALQLDPLSSRACLAMAKLQAKLDAVSAETLYGKAAALAPDDWIPHSEHGGFLYRAARYRDAAAEWEEAARLAPDNVFMYRNLGAAYHMLDEFEKSESALQRSLQIDPSAAVWSNLGTARFFRGHYTESVAAYEKAVELNPNNYLNWGNLGDGYRWAPGQRNKAAQAYGRAIALVRDLLNRDPKNNELLGRLAVYLARSGDAAATRVELAKLVEAPNVLPADRFEMALANEVLGDREAALGALGKAIRGGYSLREIKNEPELAALRSDVRYYNLISQAPPPR